MSNNRTSRHQCHPPYRAGTPKYKMGGKPLHSYTNTQQLWLVALSPHSCAGDEHHTSPQGRCTRQPWSMDQKEQQYFRELHVLFPVIFSSHLSAGPSFLPQQLLESPQAAVVQVLPSPRLFHLTWTIRKQNSSRTSSCSEHCWLFPLFHSHFQ